MSPDEKAAAIAHHLRAKEGTGAAFDIDILEVRAGYAKIAMTARADMLNGHGICHGGLIFTLADTAFAYACNSHNRSSVAQHAAITFLAPVPEGARLVAEAKEDAVAGRTGAYSATVRIDDDAVVAVFNGVSRTIGGAVLDDRAPSPVN